MSEKLIAHYQGLLDKHGPSAEAVQWADSATQRARFSILAEISDDLGSVLDFGCGLGDLCLHLRKNGFTGAYHGVDIVPDFVAHANAVFQDDDKAQASLIKPGEALPTGYDFVLLSGVFNNRMDDNRGFMEDTLRAMWDAAEKGIAFNAMSTWVDFQDDALWYVDPSEVFAFCKEELGGHPVLRHDYALRDGGYPFEFAVYVRKSPGTA